MRPAVRVAPRVRLVPEAGGGWLVVLGDGTEVGRCGWRPVGTDETEISYEIAPRYRRRGYGFAAVTEMVGRLPTPRIVAEVHAGNLASRRLLEKAGFALDAVEPPYLRFARFAPEQKLRLP